MDYPFWELPFSYGIMMAVIGIVHVFVSHFAIGGGLYLVVTEHFARKRNDTARLAYLESLSKFFALTTLVFGALTGVGIWFIIGLLNPQATSLLIHNFVWGWAVEWTFFLIEIAAAIIYYYGWRSMSPSNHLKVGWIYFAAAWLSLVIINGILAFMLTPGGWLETGSFWQGFFNPTYFSSLVFRTGICLLMAGLFGTVVATRMKDAGVRGSLVRYNTWWGLIGLAVMAPTFYWYWNAIPDAIRQVAELEMPTPINAINGSFVNAAMLLVLLIVFGLLIPRKYKTGIAIFTLLVGFAYFGEFEWFRESLRKPYIVYDYMYGNAQEVAHADEYARDGLLNHIAFAGDDPASDLYNHTCGYCHTVNGYYHALAPWFNGTDQAFIAAMVKGTGVMKGHMPPFMGTEADADLIAAHIYEQVDHRHIAEIYNLEGVELGKKVYNIRCGPCHEIGGFNDKFASLVGLGESDYRDLLGMAEYLGDRMPAFTGDEQETAALIQYLMTLKGTQGGPNESAGL